MRYLLIFLLTALPCSADSLNDALRNSLRAERRILELDRADRVFGDIMQPRGQVRSPQIDLSNIQRDAAELHQLDAEIRLNRAIEQTLQKRKLDSIIGKNPPVRRW